MNRLCLASIAAAAAVASPLAHAAQYVYPAKGQDAATQTKDKTECSAWAMQQTGYDPANPPAPAAAPAPAVAAATPAATPASAGVSRGNTDALMSALGGLGGGGGANNLLAEAGALTKGLGGQGTSTAVTALTGNSTLGTAASLLGTYMNSKPAAAPAAPPVAATPVAAVAAPAADAEFLKARALCLSARGYNVQ
jgi:hypothetical protein